MKKEREGSYSTAEISKYGPHVKRTMYFHHCCTVQDIARNTETLMYFNF